MRRQKSRSVDTRAALLIRCSKADAETIRQVAKRERRTISGFVMHVVMNYVGNRETIAQKVKEKIEVGKKQGHMTRNTP